MLVDIILEKETVLTISMKSVNTLLKNTDKTSFPVVIDGKEVRIQFRKEAGD